MRVSHGRFEQIAATVVLPHARRCPYRMVALTVLAILAALPVVTAQDARQTCPASGCGVSPMGNEFFPFIQRVGYDPAATDPFTFRYYNKHEVVLGKPMSEWFRFSVAFWHTIMGTGSDPFGGPTKKWPWHDPALTPMQKAEAAMRANFELIDKLGVDFWCFHDRDIAPGGATLAESNANLDKIVALAEKLQKQTGTRPLWGTAQLFAEPWYMHGASTSPQAEVFARAAAQAKKAMDVTHKLGGLNFVFWGGREGYTSLLNTDMGLELKHLAAFLKMAVDYKAKIGFNGTLLIEPKPKEPSIHQYDWDAATSIGFLRAHNLSDSFAINVECNHATLSGHSCVHELETSRLAGMLGSVDANTGDLLTGWDTDQFLTDPRDASRIMRVIIANGGLAPGGFNFDAKLRRESVDVEDIVIAHIAGMDALARGLRSAAKIIEDGRLDALKAGRYASFQTGIGADIEAGKVGWSELEAWVLKQNANPAHVSAKLEHFERLEESFI
jgi:xylose isomerase